MDRYEQTVRARQMLDRRLSQLPPVSEFTPPRAGWIRALRDALGLSARELGRRMGVSGATIGQMEANEREGGVRLSTLRRAAEAMDCALVYAFVPRESLEATVRHRAEWIFSKLQQHADQTMRLEEQEAEWSESARQRQLEEIVRSRSLWSQLWDEQ